MDALWAALCLVAVLEGLALFVAPAACKRAAEQLLSLPERQLRTAGGLLLAIGLLLLWWVRQG